jgi:streptogramin lyase
MKGKLSFLFGAALTLIAGVSQLAQAAPNLFVVASNSNDVRRYDGNTGAPLGSNASGGGLTLPLGATLGPDGNLYVSDGANPGFVNRYNANSGAFINTFVTAGSGGMTNAAAPVFGPDGNLYVASFADSTVKRYNGTTGAFINNFSSVGSPVDLRWGPSGDLYVASRGGSVFRVNGVTGANLGTFASSGALSGAEHILFGPNGDLYLSGDANGGKIRRFNGATGALVGDVLVGLSDNTGFLFDSNGDLLVARSQLDRVDRYNATTGAFIQTLVAAGVGGPDGPNALIYVPEPSSACLITAAAAFLAARRKRLS